MRRRLLFALLVGAFLAFLAACGGSGGDSGKTEGPSKWDEMAWDEDSWE